MHSYRSPPILVMAAPVGGRCSGQGPVSHPGPCLRSPVQPACLAGPLSSNPDPTTALSCLDSWPPPGRCPVATPGASPGGLHSGLVTHGGLIPPAQPAAMASSSSSLSSHCLAHAPLLGVLPQHLRPRLCPQTLPGATPSFRPRSARSLASQQDPPWPPRPLLSIPASCSCHFSLQ